MQAGGEFDPNFDRKVRKVAEKISENVHNILNEPSLGLYRIQEHVRKSMPLLVSKKMEASQQLQQLQGACYDMELTLNATKGLLDSRKHFASVHDMMKNSIFHAQQIQYEKTRSMNAEIQQRGRAGGSKLTPGSMSVDIADRSSRLPRSPAAIKASRTLHGLQAETASGGGTSPGSSVSRSVSHDLKVSPAP
ncbi:BLOC-1-related complex subunit 8 homolog [Paramacrobiotus metropolitanus]|uniref:BLOC-1-related complex subunit 8 homolog n=1 Tax=Paramacrobiotus metropolitanus TaxID=2943436 RepID=UPI0024464E4D|nr:BLOC-1-related complex subunit 8 homolog [Paramacrobiotus metropolitanus]